MKPTDLPNLKINDLLLGDSDRPFRIRAVFPKRKPGAKPDAVVIATAKEGIDITYIHDLTGVEVVGELIADHTVDEYMRVRAFATPGSSATPKDVAIITGIDAHLWRKV